MAGVELVLYGSRNKAVFQLLNLPYHCQKLSRIKSYGVCQCQVLNDIYSTLAALYICDIGLRSPEQLGDGSLR